MARIDDLLTAQMKSLPPKPGDKAGRSAKQGWSQKVSEAVALAFGEELRKRGMEGSMPVLAKGGGKSGAERRMSGGIGAKQVDVSWATETSGLILAISIKTINFRDLTSGNFQKNLTNRRGDMLFESVTLHRRFPFAVLGGFMILDKGAASDNTAKRRSTFLNAHSRLQLFSGRDDPAAREEQYERLYILLLDNSRRSPRFQTFGVGSPTAPLKLNDVFTDLVQIVATRNPDFYEPVKGSLRRAS